jgi:hypothetical protein
MLMALALSLGLAWPRCWWPSSSILPFILSTISGRYVGPVS